MGGGVYTDLFMRTGSGCSNRKSGSTHVFRAFGLLVLLADVVATVVTITLHVAFGYRAEMLVTNFSPRRAAN